MKKYKINLKQNKSKNYFLPLMKRFINLEFFNQLLNSYICNNEEENSFSILYKWSGKEGFTKFEGKLMEHELFLGHEDYEDYVLYKFKVPEELNDTFKLFKNGKYSMYSDEDKKIILDHLEETKYVNRDHVSKVLRRDASLRKFQEKRMGVELTPSDEVLGIPDEDEENFSKNVKEINYIRAK